MLQVGAIPAQDLDHPVSVRFLDAIPGLPGNLPGSVALHFVCTQGSEEPGQGLRQPVGASGGGGYAGLGIHAQAHVKPRGHSSAGSFRAGGRVSSLGDKPGAHSGVFEPVRCQIARRKGGGESVCCRVASYAGLGAFQVAIQASGFAVGEEAGRGNLGTYVGQPVLFQVCPQLAVCR